MTRTKCEQRISIRLAGSLLDQLAAEAAQDGRPLAGQVRQILVDHVAHRVIGTAGKGQNQQTETEQRI
jgi:hypothetical protein